MGLGGALVSVRGGRKDVVERGGVGGLPEPASFDMSGFAVANALDEGVPGHVRALSTVRCVPVTRLELPVHRGLSQPSSPLKDLDANGIIRFRRHQLPLASLYALLTVFVVQ